MQNLGEVVLSGPLPGMVMDRCHAFAAAMPMILRAPAALSAYAAAPSVAPEVITSSMSKISFRDMSSGFTTEKQWRDIALPLRGARRFGLRSRIAVAHEDIVSDPDRQAFSEVARDFFGLVESADVLPSPAESGRGTSRYPFMARPSSPRDTPARSSASGTAARAYATELQVVDQAFERGVIVRARGAKKRNGASCGKFFWRRASGRRSVRKKASCAAGSAEKHGPQITPAPSASAWETAGRKRHPQRGLEYF